ncbi:MAG: hypothetical protein IPN46_19075 [Saprospiraceae bacterium]|nr:hypothetical protein [Saprospiraceae bacterium]
MLKVDPSTFGISGEKQAYCSHNLLPTATLVMCEASSLVNTCTKELNVTITHSDANGTNYGPGAIVLKKK